jgi:hypothetical protein
MKLKNLIKSNKILHDEYGTFKATKTLKGKRVMTFTSEEGTFIISASLVNYNRFVDWDGNKAYADILPTGNEVKLIDGRICKTVRIRTSVKLDVSKGEEEVF